MALFNPNPPKQTEDILDLHCLICHNLVTQTQVELSRFPSPEQSNKYAGALANDIILVEPNSPIYSVIIPSNQFEVETREDYHELQQRYTSAARMAYELERGPDRTIKEVQIELIVQIQDPAPRFERHAICIDCLIKTLSDIRTIVWGVRRGLKIKQRRPNTSLVNDPALLELARLAKELESKKE